MLELAYAAAPKSMKGFVTACFLLTNTLANLLNIFWTPMYGGSLVGRCRRARPADARAVLRPSRCWSSSPRRWPFVFVGNQFERTQAEAAAAGVT